MKQFMVLYLMIWIWVIFLCGIVHSERPESVNIGAVFTFESVIGRVAKAAMEMAVSDVNSDQTVLNGTKLNLIMKDGMCNAFLGSTGGTKLQP
jgi:ionotropic glutamate receptor